MIHGDIKPANIFITEDTGAKSIGFRFCRKLANVEVAPSEGIWGSPYYISPETRRPEGGGFPQRCV